MAYSNSMNIGDFINTYNDNNGVSDRDIRALWSAIDGEWVNRIKPIVDHAVRRFPVDDQALAQYVKGETRGKNLCTREIDYIKETYCLYSKAINNQDLNRYSNVLPFDHTLYAPKINGGKEEYYLNASEIKLDNNHYVATQGPLPETVNHFWQAVVAGASNKIISLAMPQENGNTKCHPFWENNVTLYEGNTRLGDIVFVKAETVIKDRVTKQGIVKRKFRWMPSKDLGEPNEITQYHYLNWPHQGNPDINLFNQFIDLINETPTSGPKIVHCSAGIGRTGAFIAADHLNLQVRENKAIDIRNTVVTMRLAREAMILDNQMIAIIRSLYEKNKPKPN